MADSLSVRTRRSAAESPDPAPAVEPSSPSRPAALLTVGSADDPAEAAADRAADTALSRLRRLADGAEQPDDTAGPATPFAQAHRHGHGCGHDAVQRQTVPTTGPEVGRDGGALSTDTSAAIAGLRGSGAPLPTALRENLETAFRTPLDRVRIHTGPRAEALNDAVSAHAFTVGQDIFFGAGSFRPETPAGAHTLGHEVAHTLQDAGPVQRTANDAPIRRYTKTSGGSKKGSFVGPPSGCHLHLDIASPHLKVGTKQNTRINFGFPLDLNRMQRAYDTLLAVHAGKPGFADCKEWLEEQGCAPVGAGAELKKLKDMLLSWGGLMYPVGTDPLDSDAEYTRFGYFDDGARWIEVDGYTPAMLDKAIMAQKATIYAAAASRDAFQDAGGDMAAVGKDEDVEEDDQ